MAARGRAMTNCTISRTCYFFTNARDADTTSKQKLTADRMTGKSMQTLRTLYSLQCQTARLRFRPGVCLTLEDQRFAAIYKCRS